MTADESRMVVPVELRNMEFGRSVRGYDPAEVDAALARARGSYERMWRERLGFEIEAKELRAEVARLEQEQDMIRDVLVAAKRTANEFEEASRAEAEEVRRRAEHALAAAEIHARELVDEAQAKADELVRRAQEQADATARGAHERAWNESREAREEAATRQAEVERLRGLEQEMKAGYRAFLVAALELLEGSAPTPADEQPAVAGTGPGRVEAIRPAAARSEPEPEEESPAGPAGSEAREQPDEAQHTDRAHAL